MYRVEYTIASYGSMIADPIRMDAYVRALEQTVRPGMSCSSSARGRGRWRSLPPDWGAAQVIAVEVDNVIEVARQTASANGMADRITFVQARSTELRLPQPADVLVSDLRGILPFHSGHVAAIVDARERLLDRSGVMIPLRDTVWAAVVEAPEAYSARVGCWTEQSRGFDLDPARQLVANTWWKHKTIPSQLLSESVQVSLLDYQTIQEPSLDFEGNLAIHRRGTAHGLAVWFDTELTDGVGFSNAPDQPEAIYGNAFFPLLHPVAVRQGDQMLLRLRARPTAGDYVWSWSSTVEREGEILAQFRQSTALSFPFTHATLERSSADYVPALTADGEALRLTLDLMNDDLSLSEIAVRVAQRFPQRFSHDEDALQFTVRVAQKYA